MLWSGKQLGRGNNQDIGKQKRPGGLPYFPESVDARTTIRGRDEEEGEMEAWVSG